MNEVTLQSALDENCGRGFPIAWTLAFLLILIAIIVFIILYIRLGTVKIDPAACPIVRGNYGVQPAMQGTILQVCGDDGVSPCTSQQSSLQDAINSCDAQFNICSGFTYDDSGTFSIVDTRGQLSSTTTNINLYLRQTAINQTF